MITFYDLATPIPRRISSPNTMKTRLTLNYKGLPYTTEWVEFPDIRELYNKLDVKPNLGYLNNPDFSLPMITDHSTGVSLCESFAIAKYLDETYPDTPKLVPSDENGEMEKQITFIKELELGFIQGALPLIFKQSLDCGLLTARGREFINTTRPPFLSLMGKNVTSAEEVNVSLEEKEVQWGKLKQLFNVMAERFGGTEKFSWFMGDTISFADLVMGGWILSQREIWGEESEEWKDMMSWNDGKWAKLAHGIKEYEALI
ncbi:hypothetical protein BKA70DRAFT_1567888 [Coprinopsis sp. MPI-PUGE-AT-0042]|nr:hypothetical protein BKA70DRAFT_1567888 [Coprinopsis sp. MPI-PUGE-AT-0042]